MFVSHKGQRAPGYLELWATDPPRPVAGALLGRRTIARSRDGSATVASTVAAGNLVIERPGRCFALELAFDSRFALELSPDGNELYLGDNNSVPDGHSWFMLWRTDTGEPGAVLGDVTLAPDSPSHVWWSPEGAQLTIDTTRGSEIAVALQRP